MAARRPLIRAGGRNAQIPTGDTLLAVPPPLMPLSANTLLVAGAYGGHALRVSNSAILTLSSDEVGGWEAGSGCFELRAVGSGLVRLVGAEGVTLNPPSNGTLSLTQGMTLSARRIAANEWDISGDSVRRGYILFVGDPLFSTGTSQALELPTTVVAGDSMTVVVTHGSTLTAPSGWTLVGAQTDTVPYQSTYRRTATSSDAGSSFTWFQADAVDLSVQLIITIQ